MANAFQKSPLAFQDNAFQAFSSVIVPSGGGSEWEFPAHLFLYPRRPLQIAHKGRGVLTFSGTARVTFTPGQPAKRKAIYARQRREEEELLLFLYG